MTVTPVPRPLRRSILGLARLALLPLALGACGPHEPGLEPATPDLAGNWRAVLTSPGGELPFTLRIRRSAEGLVATAINGAEEAPFSTIAIDGNRVTLAIDWYDSEIEATLTDGGRRLDGRWHKTVAEGVSSLAFRAVKDDAHRFGPVTDGGGAAEALATVTGSWGVIFTDDDGSQKALGELVQEEDRVSGTFLTPTGDYRFLEGSYQEGTLRLSCFDGAHAFLFHAHAQEDGSLSGDFWSRDSYHATWIARRLEPESQGDALPDPFELVRLTNQHQHFDFNLPDLDGKPLSLSDQRFQGKVVLVNIFGSWCPNCNDEAPVLAQWYRRYRERGLEIVGLAFEVTGDPERDAVFVRKFARRHQLDYPMVLAGTSDKAAAGALLGDLDRVAAFPTSIFIGRDRRVRRIHSGFSGPGTGTHHGALISEMEALIEEMLAEPAAPATPAG